MGKLPLKRIYCGHPYEMTRKGLKEYEAIRNFMADAMNAEVSKQAFTFFLHGIREGNTIAKAIRFARKEWDL